MFLWEIWIEPTAQQVATNPLYNLNVRIRPISLLPAQTYKQLLCRLFLLKSNMIHHHCFHASFSRNSSCHLPSVPFPCSKPCISFWHHKCSTANRWGGFLLKLSSNQPMTEDVSFIRERDRLPSCVTGWKNVLGAKPLLERFIFTLLPELGLWTII